MTDTTALKLWLQLAKTSSSLQARINARLKDKYNQSMVRFDVLSQLARSDDQTMQISALSRALIASSGNITRLLDRMQSEGLIIRTPAPHDRRSVLVTLSAPGAALFDKMAKDHARWVDDLLTELPGQKKSDLLESLHELQSVLSKCPGGQDRA